MKIAKLIKLLIDIFCGTISIMTITSILLLCAKEKTFIYLIMIVVPIYSLQSVVNSISHKF